MMQLVADKNEKISEPVKIKQEIIGGGKLIYEMFRTELMIEGHITCVYGIGITSSLFNDKETCMIRDITSCFEKVAELFELIVSNIVLPCTLKDIVSDYLD